MLDNLKTEVTKLLITNYDFLQEDAESAVDESVRDNPDLWHDNASPADLAKYLADDEDSE